MYVFSKCVTLTKLSLKNWEMNNSHNTAHLRKNDKLSLTEKIFREINSLVTSLVKPLVSRNFCQKVRERISVHMYIISTTVHRIVEKREILSHKNISSNCLFNNFFNRIVTFTIFSKKCVRVNRIPIIWISTLCT